MKIQVSILASFHPMEFCGQKSDFCPSVLDYTLNCHLVTMITNDHGAAEIKNLHHFVKEEISCCWEIPMKNKSRGSLSAF